MVIMCSDVGNKRVAASLRLRHGAFISGVTKCILLQVAELGDHVHCVKTTKRLQYFENQKSKCHRHNKTGVLSSSFIHWGRLDMTSGHIL